MEKEQVNHPSHYNQYPIEVIEMMVRIWGKGDAYKFCMMNAFKYRMRLGLKGSESFDQDLAKEKWYLDKAKEIGEPKSFTFGVHYPSVDMDLVRSWMKEIDLSKGPQCEVDHE